MNVFHQLWEIQLRQRFRHLGAEHAGGVRVRPEETEVPRRVGERRRSRRRLGEEEVALAL